MKTYEHTMKKVYKVYTDENGIVQEIFLDTPSTWKKLYLYRQKAFVWERCDEKISLKTLRARLSRESYRLA